MASRRSPVVPPAAVAAPLRVLPPEAVPLSGAARAYNLQLQRVDTLRGQLAQLDALAQQQRTERLVRERVRRGIRAAGCALQFEHLVQRGLRRLEQAGVNVTLNTDTLTVSDVTLSEEYARAVERNGITLPGLWALDQAALEAAIDDWDRALNGGDTASSGAIIANGSSLRGVKIRNR
mgnify:CR=1 FL=1